MKKILLILLLWFISSCSTKLIPEKKVNYYSLDVSIPEIKNSKNITLFTIDGVEYLLTSKIAYRENYRWGYFQTGEWICSPDCILEKNLIKNLPYIRGNSKNKLFIKILDFYVDFQPDGIFVVSSFKVNLQTESKEIGNVFNYRLKVENNGMENIILNFENVISNFIKDLDIWLFQNL